MLSNDGASQPAGHKKYDTTPWEGCNLYLDLDGTQALAAMGLPDDGSNRSESFLDARRGAMWHQALFRDLKDLSYALPHPCSGKAAAASDRRLSPRAGHGMQRVLRALDVLVQHWWLSRADHARFLLACGQVADAESIRDAWQHDSEVVDGILREQAFEDWLLEPTPFDFTGYYEDPWSLSD